MIYERRGCQKLNEGIDKRGDAGRLGEDKNKAEDQKNNDQRNQKPHLGFPKILK